MRARKKVWAEPFINEHVDLLYNKDIPTNLPLTLEIGIGKGDFIIANAKYNDNYLHIGDEINTSIFAIAMKKIVNENINNIRLINAKAIDLLSSVKENSVDIIYLNFSDPWPQNGYRKRRLVHPVHLEIFEKILKDNGEIRFKTDNLKLFEMGVKNFKGRGYKIILEDYNYQTTEDDFVSEYEARFRALGQPIYKIIAKVNKEKLLPWGELAK